MKTTGIMSTIISGLIIAAMLSGCSGNTLKGSQDTLPGNSNEIETQADTQSNRKETIYDDDILREYGGVFHNDRFNDICPIKYNDIITIFDTEILLYPTFVDQNEAITKLAAKMSDFLDVLADERNLAPLSDDNWEEYSSALYVHMNRPDYNSEDDYGNIEYLLCFFDIYDNKSANAEIRQVLSSYGDNNGRKQVKDSLPSEIQISEEDEEDIISALIIYDIRLRLPYFSLQEFDAIPEVQRLLEIMDKLE